MTWSYEITDLATSQKDQMRFLICDTHQNDEPSAGPGRRDRVCAVTARFGVGCCRRMLRQGAHSSDRDQSFQAMVITVSMGS